MKGLVYEKIRKWAFFPGWCKYTESVGFQLYSNQAWRSKQSRMLQKHSTVDFSSWQNRSVISISVLCRSSANFKGSSKLNHSLKKPHTTYIHSILCFHIISFLNHTAYKCVDVFSLCKINYLCNCKVGLFVMQGMKRGTRFSIRASWLSWMIGSLADANQYLFITMYTSSRCLYRNWYIRSQKHWQQMKLFHKCSLAQFLATIPTWWRHQCWTWPSAS